MRRGPVPSASLGRRPTLRRALEAIGASSNVCQIFWQDDLWPVKVAVAALPPEVASLPILQTAASRIINSSDSTRYASCRSTATCLRQRGGNRQATMIGWKCADSRLRALTESLYQTANGAVLIWPQKDCKWTHFDAVRASLLNIIKIVYD